MPNPKQRAREEFDKEYTAWKKEPGYLRSFDDVDPLVNRLKVATDLLLDQAVAEEREKNKNMIIDEINELKTWAKVTTNEQDKKEYNFAIFVLSKILTTPN